MTIANLRQACPEFFDFVVAISKQVDYGDRNFEEPLWSQGAINTARALLAKLEAEKASAETALRERCPNCLGGERVDPKRGVVIECTCPPKPEPPKRSAEDVLEMIQQALAPPSNVGFAIELLPEALRLVRELRAELDTERRQRQWYKEQSDELQAERDELQRRIEAARAALDMHGLAPKSSAGVALRILGGER